MKQEFKAIGPAAAAGEPTDKRWDWVTGTYRGPGPGIRVHAGPRPRPSPRPPDKTTLGLGAVAKDLHPTDEPADG